MRLSLAVPFLLTLLWINPVLAQQTKSPAELMPGKTLAYAEIRHAGELAREVGALFKNSALGDMPESLFKLRDKHSKEPLGHSGGGAGFAGMLFCEEVIAELGRLEGAAIAFTGMGADHQPEYVAVILAGQSNAPGFLMRMFLASAPVRAIETVEGVTLYRMAFSAPMVKGIPGKPLPPMPKHHEEGTTFARASGTLIIGSTNNVKEVIMRIKGKGAGASLAESATFQEVRKQIQDQPGMFAYANPGELLPMLSQLPGPPNQKEKSFVQQLSQAINPKAVRAVVMGYGLKEGTLSYRKVALLNPQEKSPLLEIMPTKPLDPALLRFVPADALLAAAVSNADGEQRWQLLLALGDQLTPEGSKMPMPSASIKQMEAKLGINFGKEVLGQIKSAAFAMGNPMKARMRRVEVKGPNFTRITNEPEMPLLYIVQAVDAKAAKNLENLIPTLFGEKATTEQMGGVQLNCIKLGEKHNAIFYGREGSTLVLGPYAGPVSQSLKAGSKGNGLLGDARVADRIKQMKDREALLVMKPVELIGGAAMFFVSAVAVTNEPAKMKAIGPVDSQPAKTPRPAPKEEDECQGKEEKNQDEKVTTTITYPARSPEEEKMLKALSKIFEQEDWFILGLQRTKDRVQIDGKGGNLRQLVPDITNFIVEETYRAEARRHEHFKAIEPLPIPREPK